VIVFFDKIKEFHNVFSIVVVRKVEWWGACVPCFGMCAYSPRVISR
jgi:hypothetical protein